MANDSFLSACALGTAATTGLWENAFMSTAFFSNGPCGVELVACEMIELVVHVFKPHSLLNSAANMW
jgi:hypothetical protein